MKRFLPLLAALWCLLGLRASAQTISLAGTWRFALDRSDAGIQAEWFNHKLTNQIKLPGTLTEQGIGDDVTTNTTWVGGIVDRSWFTEPEYAKYREPGNVKVPYWLQPEKYYAGAAWFQRDLEIPQRFAGQRVVLFLERAHWETRVWVDGKLIGTNQSLSTPHEYDLGQLTPGQHTLIVRVDNRRIVDIGENSHAISDHTQGNWNGLVGKLELRTTPLVWIEEVQIFPDASGSKIRTIVKIGNQSGKEGEGSLRVLYNHCANQKKRLLTGLPQRLLELSVHWPTTGTNIELECSLPRGSTNQWDEFSPVLHPLTFALSNGNSKMVWLGLREISTVGTQFLINRTWTFFRGTLECAIFPKTGHPPTDIGEWRRIIGVAKSFGLNLLRFHSYCPPEAAFQAADELGMYLQVETCWPNQSTTIGDGQPVDQWVYDETERILKCYGNHPSFVLMTHGNEPGGKQANAYLAQYVNHFKALDSRRLWTSGAGWPELAENQFHVSPRPRIQQWEEGLKSRINARPPETTTDYRDYIAQRTVPVISHEIGQWCVYPNLAEIPKYTGYLKPRNFEIFRDQLAAAGMGELAKQFLLASGKLQALCYKEEIESALRTPGMGGFELLDLHDFPGQGTALVGVLDPFWEEKGYVTAKEYRRFCNAIVPLARLQKRVFTTDEPLTAGIEVANFGAQPIPDAVVEWKLVTSSGKVFARGELAAKTIPVGNGIALSRITVDVKKVKAPAQMKLVVGIKHTRLENDWNVWVYPSPAATETPPNLLITDKFDAAAQQRLQAGGNVLLAIPGQQVRNYAKDPVKLGFSSIFWNTAWTARQAPTTLGILCDPKHPALAGFPTAFHSDWQWWYLIHRAGALRLDGLPKDLKPIVRVIDDWVTARPLGLVLEGKVGAGKILVCGFDLTHTLETNPVARQMRQSLLAYMASKTFQPASSITEAQISNLLSAAKN